MNNYIRTILALALVVISYITAYCETSTNEIRKVLDDVEVVIKEKPDSAFRVLKALEIPEDEKTMAEYSILIAKAEYLATGRIESDTLLLKAIDFYGETRSKETAIAHYSLGCCYFSRDYDKAIHSFENSIERCPDDEDEMKGRAYHAIGTCWLSKGDINEYLRASKKALKLLEGNESDEIRILCQEMRHYLNVFEATDQKNEAKDSVILYIILTSILVSGIGVAAYMVIMRKKDSSKEVDDKPASSALEEKLKEGRSALEMTSAYSTLLEIRSLNEGELQARNDIDSKAIEDAVRASFDDAYQILARSEEKISHQDLLLCLYGYLKLSNNVIAFLLRSVPVTIRQRRKRLQGKLSPEAYQILFS
ncbi:MAG: tetratricopeptide repeat protein [Bacteroidales bacterium]|nr:tetratricopeptide repeat protein [Bacteroidales bacterium]